MRAALGTLLGLSLWILAAAPAAADVAPIPPPGKAFAATYLRLENLAEHPGFAFVVYDPSKDGKLYASRTFKAGGENELELANGNSNRGGQLGHPGVWLLTAAQERAWSAQTSKTIDEQMKACAERGEGCVHISRFVPHYAAPKGGVDCGVRIDVTTAVPEGAETRIVERYRIVEASAKRCRLQRLSTTAQADEEAPSPPEDVQPASALGCDALAGAGGAAGVMPLALPALLFALRRRR